ncbi:hypothetical protein DER30_6228 [Streptomyces sp. HB202]|nr:hypothetical protein DER30_6228 [Streptomyces sp. HB202]
MTWRRRPAQVHPGRRAGRRGRGEVRGVRDDRAAVLPPRVLLHLPDAQSLLVGLVIGVRRLVRVLRLRVVPPEGIGLDPQRPRMAQIREHVLQQRTHAGEHVRQDSGQFAMGLGVDVVDVRTEDRVAVGGDLDVRGQPLELLRELVGRVAVVGLVPPGLLGSVAHPAHQTEQRGMHQVQHLPVGPGMPVPLRCGDLLKHPGRLAQPGPERVVDQGVRLPHPVDRGHLDAGPGVPQRCVMGEFGEHVADLRPGETLGGRFPRPPGDDLGIVHLVEPAGLRPDVCAAPDHLQLPQRSRCRERWGGGGVKGQRESRQAGQRS